MIVIIEPFSCSIFSIYGLFTIFFIVNGFIFFTFCIGLIILLLLLLSLNDFFFVKELVLLFLIKPSSDFFSFSFSLSLSGLFVLVKDFFNFSVFLLEVILSSLILSFSLLLGIEPFFLISRFSLNILFLKILIFFFSFLFSSI